MKNLSKKLLLLFIASIFFWGNIFSQQTLKQHIDKIAERYVSKKKNHSLIIGIAINGEDVVESYGQLSKKNNTLPDENTLYEIGGITSVFTTSLMQIQSDKGIFYQGNPIEDYLKTDYSIPKYRSLICRDVMIGSEPSVFDNHNFNRKIYTCEVDVSATPTCMTFCDLATHISSLPSSYKGWYKWNPFHTKRLKKDRYKDPSLEEFMDKIQSTQIDFPPGVSFQHSDVGIALLGNALSDINQKPYEELVKNELFFPLGMFDTYINQPNASNRTFAPGHNRRGNLVEHWHFDGMAPAAGMRSTMRDMLYFLNANLNTSNKTLANAFEQVQQSRFNTKKLKLERGTMAGYGWFISTLNEQTNQPVIWANGGTGGFRAFIGFVKDTQTGIVIFSNSANSIDEMAFEILELLHSPVVKNNKSNLSSKMDD